MPLGREARDDAAADTDGDESWHGTPAAPPPGPASAPREPNAGQADEAFHRLFQAVPVPIAISTLARGIFSHCNDEFVRAFGYPREEVIGHGSVELGMWSPAQRAAAIAELSREGGLHSHESTVRTKSGDVRNVLFNMERIELGGQIRLVGFFYDITERKRSEEELRRLYQQLKELDQLKGQLVANVSHELRTPLTLILGLTERLIHDGAEDGARRADLLAVQRNALGLLKQVSDLLDVARLDAGKVEPHYSALDLAHELRLVASPFDVVAAERGIDYAIVAPERVAAETDADKFERIAVNLLSNAFKYTPPGGRVRCALETVGERVVLSVADSGPGIPPEYRTRVFERFFQVEGGATRRHGGTGLGLAIVRELAEVLGGKSSIDEAPGGGALVTIDLPRLAPPGSAVDHGPVAHGDTTARSAISELMPAPAPADDSAAPADERPLVLVVEDNAEMRRFVMDSLGEGYRVIGAGDGEEGLEKALAHHPDLVVTDVMMPRMSGDRLVAALGAAPELEHVRILLLTAKADDALRVRMLREGAHDFVTKPFAVSELRARVDNQVAIKRADDAMRAEIRAQAVGVETLAQQLRQSQKMEAIGRLAGGVAHDFNNLLTVIGGYASLITENEAPGALAHDLASEIKQASDRAAELTRQLLAFSRRQMLNLQVLDPNTVVAGLERMLRRIIGEDIALTTRLGSGLGNVRADKGQLDQVLINLAVNARDAMPEGGQLAIETDEVVLDEAYSQANPDVRPGDYVVVSVSDTGLGMTEEVKQRIFEPFFTTKEIGKGTGLGLATVYGIIKQTGGHIAFHSEVGRGSVFNVYLPRIDASSLDQPHDEASDVGTNGSESVLLVEDDPMVRAFARRALDRLGYRVEEAVDGHAALELLGSGGAPIDVVVTDVVMPILGGRELAQRVASAWPGTRILFVSGYTDDAALRHGIEAGACFLQKPFTASELACAVRRALA